MSDLKKATIIATSEQINVYKLENGNYYDYDGLGENKPPTATKANKKEFEKKELRF